MTTRPLLHAAIDPSDGLPGQMPVISLDGTVLEWGDPIAGGLPAGGTTGQVLTKLSAADGDAGWATPAAGGGGGSPTPPAIRGANAATANASSVTVAIPAATVAGDLLIAFASSGYSPSAAPAGWQFLKRQATEQPSGIFEDGAMFIRVAEAGDAGANVGFPFTGSYSSGATIVAVSGVSAIQETSILGIGAGSATTLRLPSTGGGDGFRTLVFAGARATTGSTTCGYGASIATSTNAATEGCVMTALSAAGGSLSGLLLTHSVTAKAIAGAAIKLRGT